MSGVRRAGLAKGGGAGARAHLLVLSPPRWPLDRRGAILYLGLGVLRQQAQSAEREDAPGVEPVVPFHRVGTALRLLQEERRGGYMRVFITFT